MALRPDTEDRYRAFAEEYARTLSYTKAAIACGYTPGNANRQGHRIGKLPLVKGFIKDAMAARAQRVQVDSDRVLRELARLAFSDPRKLFHPDGAPKDITELDDDTAAVISGLEVQEVYEGSGENRVFVGYVKKYRLSDKNTAITNCLKHLGMLKEVVAHTGPDGGPVEMNLTARASANLTEALKEKLRGHSA